MSKNIKVIFTIKHLNLNAENERNIKSDLRLKMKVTNVKDTMLNATFSLNWHNKTGHLVRNVVEPQNIIYIKNNVISFL